MKITGTVFALLVMVAEVTSGSEVALSNAELCRTEDLTTVSRTQIDEPVSYFFRIFPNLNLVSFNNGDNNTIMEWKTGKRMDLPGTADPVPLLNEKIISTPIFNKIQKPGDPGIYYTPKGGMSFYAMDDLRRLNNSLHLRSQKHTGLSAKPIFVDPKLIGQYQSVANMDQMQEDGSGTVRVLTDNAGHGVVIRDYEITNQIHDGKSKFQVKPMGDDVTHPCAGLRLQTPMLSHDGLMFAAVDLADHRHTKIFGLGADGKHCDLLADLGKTTGKVDFNFDGSQIAYFQSSDDLYFDKDGNYQESFDRSAKLVVYVSDLQKTPDQKLAVKATRRISPITDSNSYYPVYRKDGKIAYIYQEFTGPEDTDGEFSFALADPNPPTDSGLKCQGGDFDSLVLLGKMWSKICQGAVEPSAFNAAYAALALDPQQCREMARTHFDEWQNQTHIGTKELTVNDVVTACPRKKSDRNPEIYGSRTSTYQPANGQEVVSRKCKQCHQDGFDNANSLDSVMKKSIDDHINGAPGVERMPKGGQLSPTEISLIEDWIGVKYKAD